MHEPQAQDSGPNGRGGGARGRPRVLALPAYRRRALNPFQALLYDEVRAQGVGVADWSFFRALACRVDIWHLHHPDTVVFPRSTLQSLVETVAFRVLLGWAVSRGTRIVWTVHDLDSSDGVHPRLERWFWRFFLPRIDACIYLTATGRRLAHERFPILRGVADECIPHGDFSPAYPDDMSRQAARASLELPEGVPVLLHFGLIRPYKDVPRLVEAMRGLDAEEAVLLVAGRVWDAALERELRAQAADRANVRLHLEWIPFEDTQRWFGAADLIVLPYRRILNSGTLMLALAFGRPVLVPDRGTLAELRDRFGERWIRLYDDELDGATLRAALEWARDERPVTPDLSGLDWATLARRTCTLYERLLDPDAPLPGTRSDAPLSGSRPDAPLPGARPGAPLSGSRSDAPLAGTRPGAPLSGSRPDAPLPGTRPDKLLAEPDEAEGSRR